MNRAAFGASLAFVVSLSACSSLPENSGASVAEAIFDPLGPIRAVDARADFRAVYCSINESRGKEMPDYRPCDETFRRVAPEPRYPGTPDASYPSAARFTVLVAPGLGHDCFARLIGDDESLRLAAESLGHSIQIIPVKGLADSSENAEIIRDAILTLPALTNDERILLLGYSKGTNDILAALARFPDIAARISAVVGISSAVGGSYLARDVELWAVNLLTRVPGSECESPGEAILAELDPDYRQNWLASNELPAAVKYYSVVTFPDTDHISSALKPGYRDLAEIDPRNDGQVIVKDQVIPGSQVLAFANADHWAIALPISRTRPFVGATAVNRNDFPREVLLQAILEHVGRELSRPNHD